MRGTPWGTAVRGRTAGSAVIRRGPTGRVGASGGGRLSSTPARHSGSERLRSHDLNKSFDRLTPVGATDTLKKRKKARAPAAVWTVCERKAA
jgi:hypothetical protein